MYVYGTNSNNTLLGSIYDDFIYGFGGDDVLWGNFGNDRLDGGADDDELNGQDGNDTLLGGAGNDTLSGGWGHDLMVGHSGNDTFYAGVGADTVKGGTGIDSLHLQDLGTNSYGWTIDVAAGQATHVVDVSYTVEYSPWFGWTLVPQYTYATVDFTGVEVFYDWTRNDRMYGDDSDNQFHAKHGGNDLLLGRGGDDGLHTYAGRDRLDGGTGNDVLWVHDTAQGTILTGGADRDTFVFSENVSGDVKRATITDFSRAEGDKILLFLPGAPVDIDDAEFSLGFDQLRYENVAQGHARIEVDHNGDNQRDWYIDVFLADPTDTFDGWDYHNA